MLLVLLGESRIEPLRTLEVVEDPLPGPGSLYLTLLGSLLLALLQAAFLGQTLFANALALNTPYQKELTLPSLYLFMAPVIRRETGGPFQVVPRA